MNSTLGTITTNRRILGLLSTAIVLSPWSQVQVDPHPSPIVATIDATQVKEPILRYMSGMFIEHMGNLINHSLWSEMLDDRKFLTVAIVNPTEEPQSLKLNFDGAQLAVGARTWQITGLGPEAANVIAKTPEVEVKESDLSSVPETLKIAPVSITVYRFAVATFAAPQTQPGMLAS